jgi:hypothetical protein
MVAITAVGFIVDGLALIWIAGGRPGAVRFDLASRVQRRLHINRMLDAAPAARNRQVLATSGGTSTTDPGGPLVGTTAAARCLSVPV